MEATTENELESVVWKRLRENVEKERAHSQKARELWPQIALDMATLRAKYRDDQSFGKALTEHGMRNMNDNDRAALIYMGRMRPKALEDAMLECERRNPETFVREVKGWGDSYYDAVESAADSEDRKPVEPPLENGVGDSAAAENGKSHKAEKAKRRPKATTKREQDARREEKRARDREAYAKKKAAKLTAELTPTKPELTAEERADHEAFIAKHGAVADEIVAYVPESERQPMRDAEIVFYGARLWPRKGAHPALTYQGVWGLYWFVTDVLIASSKLTQRGIGSQLAPSVPYFQHCAPAYAAILTEMSAALL